MGGELCGLRANGGARMLVTMQQQSSPGCGVLLPRCCRSAELTATERQRKKKIWEHGEHVVRKLWMQLWAGRTQYQHSCTSRRKGKKMGHVQSFKQCTVWRATPQKSSKYDIVDYHGNASRAGRFKRDSKGCRKCAWHDIKMPLTLRWHLPWKVT